MQGREVAGVFTLDFNLARLYGGGGVIDRHDPNGLGLDQQHGDLHDVTVLTRGEERFRGELKDLTGPFSRN